MAKHAKFSPSGAEGWMNCSAWESNPIGSKDANLGTAAHHLGAHCLVHTDAPAAYLDKLIVVSEAYTGFLQPDGSHDGDQFRVDSEMVEAITRYVEFVRSIAGELLVERKLPIEQITGEAGASGTSDAVVLTTDEIVIADLKYGKGIQVFAEGNSQLRIYGKAALDEFSHLGDIKRVRTVIVQPRLNHISEEVLTVDELNAWAANVAPATEVKPGEKQCRWCEKKPTCASIRTQIIGLFENVTPNASDDVLANAMDQADMIEGWIKSIRAEVERRLLAGQSVRGYKLVQGRAGARAWSDELAVEQLFKTSMRLRAEQMYTMKVISPTQAEKVVKPRQWSRLEPYITQSTGKPSVAPASDKRSAINPAAVAEQFDVIS